MGIRESALQIINSIRGEDKIRLVTSEGNSRSIAMANLAAFFADVAQTGEYDDLLNKPTISLVGETGEYDDLLNKPTLHPIWYGTSSSSSSSSRKIVSCEGFELKTGAAIAVKFSFTNSNMNEITLNVNDTGAKPIRAFDNYAGRSIDNLYGAWRNASIAMFVYEGSNWQLLNPAVITGNALTSLADELGLGNAETGLLAAILNKTMRVEQYEYDAFTYASGFTYYSTDAYGGNTPGAYKINRVVNLVGAFKNTTQQASGKRYMGNVPPGCEPMHEQHYIQQGSGVNRYMIYIQRDGAMYLDRYGTTATAAVPANSWLNIGCSYIAKTP